MFIPADQIWIVAVGFAIAFILAFGLGANDVANSFGTSVGSKVLTLRNACILASVFEILGSILLGTSVSDTIRYGVIMPEMLQPTNTSYNVKLIMLGHLSSLTGACVWLLLATLVGLPVSGTHSVVGAMFGFALIVQNIKSLNWKKIGYIVLSWFISPLLSGIVSLAIFVIFDKFILKKDDPLEPGLRFLPFIYAITIFINVFSIFLIGPTLLKFNMVPLYGNFVISICVSIIIIIVIKFVVVPRIRRKLINLNHKSEGMTSNGTKDQNIKMINFEEKKPQNEQERKFECIIEDKPEQVAVFRWVQILTAIFGSFAHGGNDVSNAIGPLVGLWIIAVTQDISSHMPIPVWILFYGGVGIIIGLWVLGRRVMKTIGNDLTVITPSSGVAIELGAAITVLVASNIGLPISSTHCKVGSIVSVGRYRSNENVDWKIFRNIIIAWAVTLPVSGGIGALVMYLLKFTI